METWAAFWKYIFLASVTVFALMSVWVTIGGFLDIKKLFAGLKDEKNQKSIDEN